MSAIVIAGDTSGTITLQAPAVAGSTVLTLPTTNTTLLGVGQSANTNVLFNDSAAANGDADFTFNKATNALTVNGTITVNGTGNITANGTIAANIAITVSNSTIATVANSSGLYAGNSTVTASPAVTVQSNTGTSTLSLLTGTAGAANLVLTSTTFALSNATGNVQATPVEVKVSNSTAAVFTANTSAITWVPNTYNFGKTNTAGNGYCFLPGGIMLQWGTVVANSSIGTVVFSTNTGSAFPTAIWSAVATSNLTGSTGVGSGHGAVITAANATGLTIRTSNGTVVSLVRWMAIGN